MSGGTAAPNVRVSGGTAAPNVRVSGGTAAPNVPTSDRGINMKHWWSVD